METEAEKLLDYIEHEFPPENICILLKACEGDEPAYETSCEFCDIFYQFALDIINFEPTVEAVENFLEGICDIFPTNLVNACDRFVDFFYERLITSLTEEYPADVACELMGACTK
jgi:hypothetical protein